MEMIYEYELTKSEQEVLKLLTNGFSNQRIASELCVNECTVKAHVGHILKKMNVENRVQAAVKAIKKL